MLLSCVLEVSSGMLFVFCLFTFLFTITQAIVMPIALAFNKARLKMIPQVIDQDKNRNDTLYFFYISTIEMTDIKIKGPFICERYFLNFCLTVE